MRSTSKTIWNFDKEDSSETMLGMIPFLTLRVDVAKVLSLLGDPWNIELWLQWLNFKRALISKSSFCSEDF